MDRAYLRIVVTCLFLVASFTACTREDAPDWDVAGSTSAVPNQSPETTDQLIVYLDTSGSIAGYASEDGQNVFGRTLRAVRDVATSFKQPVRVSVRYVAAMVGNPDPDGALALQKASINPQIYTGGETDLAGAINSFDPKSTSPASTPKPNGVATTGASPLPAERPARFHILITDGVQSTRGQNTKLACLKGSDATCVREKIINLIKQGWAGYIIGLRSQFHGKIYPETGGRSFQYDSLEGDLKHYRPFYLYIFSPDQSALQEFVTVLLERLRPSAQQNESMRVLPLTSAYSDGSAKAELIVPKESEDALEPSGEQEENPARLTLEVNRDKDEASPVALTVAVSVPWSTQVRDSGTPAELARLLRWEVVPVFPKEPGAEGEGARRYPVVKLAKSSSPALDDAGRLPVQLTIGWPRSTAKPSWGIYRLQAKLDLGMEHDPLPWIKQWSTDLDNSKEYADRTLDLQTVLISLWRNPVLEQQTVASVYLRVGPQ